MTVKPYEEKYKEDVRFICLNSDGPCEDDADENFFILNTFCDYYIEQEPENCFVAVDENDRAVGYVICTESYDKYYECFIKEYIQRFRADRTADIEGAIHSADPQGDYKAEYPAHLHIDVLPEYHRMGIGHMMVDALCAHLKKKNVRGVMLTAGVDNEKGRGFYKKYGFTELKIYDDAVAYGLKL